MVELKLSQGAKPGHGGVLPAPKVSHEISLTRGVPMGQDCISPSRHSAFSTPIEMMQFIAEMRRLSGGKPAGFKLCVGHEWEFLAICKAMLETGIYPDFIVVDGKEGGTGAAPMEFIDHIGKPMREGLYFVHNALIGIGAAPAHQARRRGQDHHRPSTSPAPWRSAPTGAMPRAASCSRSAASSRRAATPTAARPASRPRTRTASARWWCPTRSQRVANFHQRDRARAGRADRGGRPRPSQRVQADPHLAPVSPSEVATFADLYPPLRERELLERHRQSALAQPWDMAERAFVPRRGLSGGQICCVPAGLGPAIGENQDQAAEETPMTAPFDFAPLLAPGTPAPAVKWNGFPKYNFVGGHNDAEQRAGRRADRGRDHGAAPRGRRRSRPTG